MDEQEDWVAVARLTRTRGLRGELFAIGLSSREDRYGELTRVFLFDRAGKPVRNGAPFEVESVRHIQDKLVFKFRGLDSISEAETLESTEVRIPLEERPPLPEGEFYLADLVGCEVFNRSGELLGVVETWHEFGGPPLIQVKPTNGEGELLVPFVKAICVDIDPGNRKIVADLPEGLKDLNR
ncbi:MAG: ribosome maturation factor RimM [Bryobacteraceae bacterium]